MMENGRFLRFLTFLSWVSVKVYTEEFDGFRFEPKAGCKRKEGVDPEPMTDSTPATCYEKCKNLPNSCTDFWFDTKKQVCYITGNCDPDKNEDMNSWQSCTLPFCKHCKKDRAECDTCADGKKLSYLATVCNMPDTELEGFQYRTDLYCVGDDLGESSKKSISVAQDCREKCLAHNCKIIVFNPATKACLVKQVCRDYPIRKGLQIWRACQAKNCKVCKTNVETCDECWHGAKPPECIMESDGYDYRANLNCGGNNIDNKVHDKDATQCRQLCEDNQNCKVYILRGKKCHLKSDCNKPSISMTSVIFCKGTCGELTISDTTPQNTDMPQEMSSTAKETSTPAQEIVDSTPASSQEEDNEHQRATVVGILLGVICGCVAVGAAIMLYRTRYGPSVESNLEMKHDIDDIEEAEPEEIEEQDDEQSEPGLEVLTLKNSV